MRVLVGGATGTIGSALVGQLIAAGHEVFGVTRGDGGARRLRAAGATAVVADLMDRGGLLAALDGTTADAVVHQATALTRTPMRHRDLHATDDLRIEGTANLLRAARTLGAHRFVTQSFLFGYGYHDHGDAPIREDAPFGRPGRRGFDRHLEAMRSNEEQTFGTDGIDGIALRYGFFYGFEPSTLGLFDMADKRRLVAPCRGGTVSMIHIEDAAAAAVAALERGRGGEAYNIADDRPLTWTTYMDSLAAAAGAPPPHRVPNWVLRLSPYLGAVMVSAGLRLDTGKARRELDWTPRYATCSEGLAAVATLRRAAASADAPPPR